MNIIEVAGHLGADPVTRFTPSGQKVTTFNVATNSRKGGSDVTVWFRVTVWGDRFDKILSFFKKGSAAIIVGELQKPEIWTDKEGRPQITLDVTAEIIKFSPFGKSDRAENQSGNSQASYGSFNNSREGGAAYGDSGFSGGNHGGSQPGHKRNNQEDHAEAEEDEVPF